MRKVNGGGKQYSSPESQAVALMSEVVVGPSKGRWGVREGQPKVGVWPAGFHFPWTPELLRKGTDPVAVIEQDYDGHYSAAQLMLLHSLWDSQIVWPSPSWPPMRYPWGVRGTSGKKLCRRRSSSTPAQACATHFPPYPSRLLLGEIEATVAVDIGKAIHWMSSDCWLTVERVADVPSPGREGRQPTTGVMVW